MTVCCVVLDVRDEDMIDGQDRRTMVCEIRQLRREKDEVVEENKSLAKRVKVAERMEKGERLLRIGYEMKEGGGERVSVM